MMNIHMNQELFQLLLKEALKYNVSVRTMMTLILRQYVGLPINKDIDKDV